MRIRYVALLVLLGCLAALGAMFIAVLLTARRRGNPSQCPRCDARRIRPSWPLAIEKVFPRFVCPYRCESCKKRFFASRAPWVRDA
jgi:hypothetical protein